MTKAHDDNSELSFIQIAAATANLVRYLELDKEHHPDGKRDGAQDDEQKKQDAEREEYIAQRRKDLERFEQRYLENKKQSSR